MAEKREHPASAYPKDTAGSRLAQKIRSECNSLSDDRREALQSKGMAMIYGGGQKQAARPRH